MTERDFHAKYRIVLRAADGELIKVYDQRDFEVLTPTERAMFFRLVGKILAGLAASERMRLVQ